MATTPADRSDAEAREATALKVADIIRALHRVEVENIKAASPDATDAIRNERNFWSEEFSTLFRLVEEMADAGSVDCQEVIRDYRDEYIAQW